MSPTHSSPAAIIPGSQEKLQPRHLERLAVVYVRQSTPQQVRRHQESLQVQLGLRERAVHLGWPKARVLLIDEDLGRSGTTVEGRLGFQRLVAEVGLDHVGLVLGVEMSRLARSCRDWYQLLEICAVFGTLIGDLDGIYDPNCFNDRLLLGLKGTMSEAELHVIKQRMLAGKLAKARRGELGMSLPMGYVRGASGEVLKDPDEQARSVIELIFELFERFGTLNAVLRYLAEHQFRMPCRLRHGPGKGELEWRRPNRNTLGNLLHNPIYAGAYVYGRRPIDPRRKKPGRPSTGRTVAKPEQWQICLKGRLPAYISWERYERNLRQLEANRQSAFGVPRKGPSLLSGLVVCGRCGHRMGVAYSNNGKGLRYSCQRMAIDYGEALCQSLAGEPLDRLMSELVVEALKPAALELSLKVAEDIEAERAELHRQWNSRLERAHYEVERASRQYDAVEPEHRMVARSLEQRWEAALGAEQSLKHEYTRFAASEPVPLSAEEREQIRRLAADIPALWNAPTTTAAERQEVLRQMVEKAIVNVQGESEKVDVHIFWAGGHRTQALLIRPVARLEQLSYYRELLSRTAELHAESRTASQIAAQLNKEGWRPPKRRSTFNGSMVSSILARQGLPRRFRKSKSKEGSIGRRRNEWTVRELARKLDMPHITLYAWLRRGHLKARRSGSHPGAPWLVYADKAEVERLRQLRRAPRRWSRHVRVESRED